MNWLAALIFSVQGLFVLACAVILVFLIIKRVNDKKNETFEDRDN